MKIRYELAILFSILMSTFCQAGHWQDLSRWFGYGYGDGYHACQRRAVDCQPAIPCQSCQADPFFTTSRPVQPAKPIEISQKSEMPAVRTVQRKRSTWEPANEGQLKKKPANAKTQPIVQAKRVESPKRPFFSRQAHPTVGTTVREFPRPAAKFQINQAWQPQSASLTPQHRLTYAEK